MMEAVQAMPDSEYRERFAEIFGIECVTVDELVEKTLSHL